MALSSEYNETLTFENFRQLQCDMEAEPFLLPLSVQDKAPLPAQGYHGLPPLHTWVALCMLEGLIAGWAGLGTFAFVEDKVYVELKVVLFQALDMGLDSEICLRKAQIALIHSGRNLRNPLMMHSRASDKTVNWLRRCVPRVPLAEAILTDLTGSASVVETLSEAVYQRQVETKVLMYLSSCCDPGGRDSLMFG